jgi:WD40 repeat protein
MTSPLPPRAPEYLDFDLEIGVADGSGYPVHVLASPAGEARGILHLPNSSTSVIGGRQGTAPGTFREIDPPPAMPGHSDPESVRAFGQALMEALFADALRRCYDVSLVEATHAGKRLRLRLRILDAALTTLPWEFLFDRYQRDYLVLGRRLSLVRYLEAPIPTTTLGITPPLRILALAAGPSDLPQLDVGREKQRMAGALAGLTEASPVEVTWLESGSWRDLLRALREQAWHIFHFSGHGGFDAKLGEGVLAFVGDDGKRQLLQAQEVGRLLADHPTLRLVVLNACQGAAASRTDTHSSTAAALVERGVPAVIAMQYEISDEAAIEFGRSLYEVLASELPVDDAVAEARISVSLARRGSLEWGTPVLFMRASDSALFAIQQPAAPPEVEPYQLLPCPYRGLFAFREEDATTFFGRAAATTQLVAAAQDRGLTALVGASGSGKSSLVFAGLAHQLRTAGSWLILSVRPGERPFATLAAAVLPLLEPQLSETDRLLELPKLAGALWQGEIDLVSVVQRLLAKAPDAKQLLLIVDQFEELFTLCHDAGERDAFLTALLGTTGADGNRAGVRVVLTLRADFYSAALGSRPLADALQTALLNLGPMTQDELEQAIVQPARQVGVRFEAGLVDRLLAEIGDAAGQLPLLQFALTELWAQQRVGTLTHAAYEAMGGVRQALARHAEAVYGALSADEQARAQRVLLQLVQPGEGTADTRRRATREEVGAENWALVTQLADARLLVTGRDAASGQDTVEVVHEALIANWGRLQEWMNADRRFRLWQERLRRALSQWQASNRDGGALLRGAPLVEAEGWLAQRRGDLSAAEQAFIEEGVAARRRRRLYISGWSLTGTVVLLVAVGLFLLLLRTQHQQNQQADAARLVGLAGTLAQSQPDLAMLLSVEANELNDTPVTRSNLLGRLEDYPQLSGFVRVGDSPSDNTLGSITISPLDNALLVVGLAGPAYRLDLSRNAPLEPLPSSPTKGLTSVAVSRDGKIVAAGGSAGTVQLWDGAGYQPLGAPLKGPSKGVSSLAFSSDGTTLAVGGVDGTIQLWDTTQRTLRGDPLTGSADGVYSIAFSKDGTRLAAGGSGGIVHLWNTTGSPIDMPVNCPINAVMGIAFSPDGNTLAAGGPHGILCLWDTRTLRPLGAPLALAAKGASALAFSADGRTVAAGRSNGTVVLLDRTGGGHDQPLVPALADTKTGVSSIAFSLNDAQLAVGRGDGTIQLWRREAMQYQPFGPPRKSSAKAIDSMAIDSMAFSPDGRTLAAGGADGTVRLWDTTSDHEPSTPISVPGGKVYGVAFAPGGKVLAVGLGDGTVLLWDVQHKRSLGALAGAVLGVTSVAFSPDGKTLAAGGLDGTIRLWDTAQYQPLGTPLVVASPPTPIKSVAFTPDSETLAAFSFTGNVTTWDVAIDAWIKHACTIARGNLPQPQWEQFVPDDPHQTVCHTKQ